jgi:hypothetical protein
LDQIGYSQSILNAASNAFDLNYDYGPSVWDRRHTFNGYWYYELPFRRGNHWTNRLVGGWHISGIVNAGSGLPATFFQGSCEEFGQGAVFGNWCRHGSHEQEQSKIQGTWRRDWFRRDRNCWRRGWFRTECLC